MPISTASASSVNVGSESHDFDLEASTVKPVAIYEKSEPNESDRMWNSQERHTDAKSMASTGGPVAWNSNQMQNSRASTGSLRIPSLTSICRWVQPSFCRISLIQRKSEYEITDDVESSSGDEMNDIDKHSFIWGIFMSSSMKAAVFLQRDSSEDLHFIRNKNEKPTVKKLFEVTQKLIQEPRLEISRVSEISWGTSPWERLSLTNDEEVINLSQAKVNVFSDSVLCLGKVRPFLDSNEEWDDEKRLSVSREKLFTTSAVSLLPSKRQAQSIDSSVA